MLALRGPGGVGESSGLLLRFHAGAPPPGKRLAASLGQGGPRLKWAKGRFGSKNDEKVKVLRMEFSIVENLSGLQESIFNLSRGPQLHFSEKSKNWSNFIKFIDFPLFPLFGVPWAAVICFYAHRISGKLEGQDGLSCSQCRA